MWRHRIQAWLADWNNERAAKRHLALVARRPNTHLLKDVGLEASDIRFSDDGFELRRCEEVEPGFYVFVAKAQGSEPRPRLTVIEGGKREATPVALSKAC